MRNSTSLHGCSAAFRLMIATSWLAPGAWRSQQERAIGGIAANCDWDEYLRLVDRHRTPALSWAALGKVAGLEIPPTIQRELRQRNVATRLQGLRRATDLAEILKQFDDAGIPAIPLKGPLLSQALYGDPGIRQSWDLDVLVPAEDMPRAAAALEHSGWCLASNDSALPTLTPRQSDAFRHHAHHVSYEHPQKGVLELHWNILSRRTEQTAAFWARSVPSSWGGARFRALDPIDLILHLCDHGGEHAWSRAKWLGDMARIHALRGTDWQAAYERSLATDCDRALLLCLHLLEALYDLPAPQLRTATAPRMCAVLSNHAVRELKNPTELASRVSMATAIERVRQIRYERRLRPKRKLRQILAAAVYCRPDHETLRLPDSLFWIYVPLRPALWLWRWLCRA